MISKWPGFRWRLRLRTLIVLVAACAGALWAWAQFGDPTGRLIRRLGADQPTYVRREAAVALGYGVSPSRVDRAVSALILALKDPSPRVRESAVAGLFGHKGLARRAIPDVIPLLKDDDMGVRYSAAAGLGALAGAAGPDRSLAIPALIDALADRRNDVREAAAESLIGLGEAKAAVGGLSDLMQDPDPQARGRVLRLISRWAGPNDRALVPLLLRAAKDADRGNRLEAANLLINFGLAGAATPALDEAERDGDPPFRARAAQIRAKVGPP